MSATGNSYDVVIVGLGPVGAVAANLAGVAGLRTLVVERSAEPYRQPRAIVFDAEVMRVFASIGLADEIAAVTRGLGGSVYLGADRRPIRIFRAPPPAFAGAWRPSNLFFQPQLETILRDGLRRFPHVTVLHEHEVGDLATDDDGVTVTVAPVGGKPAEVAARFLLACDGASSAVRKRLRIALDDIGFEERWLVVDSFVDRPLRWPDTYEVPPEVRDGRYSLMLCDPARPATLIPGVGRHRRWEYMLFPGEHSDDRPSDDWIRERIAEWADPAQVEIIRSAVYRFRALIAERWRQGHVFLVGDAAHQTPPFFGQGMCHGIRDAAQLIWRLRAVLHGDAGERVLHSYQAEREPHVRAIVQASVTAGAAVCVLDPDAARARDAEFRRLEAERAGKPAAITDVVPPITAGLIDLATGGARLPEFAVERGGLRTTVDALLGGRFALLSTGPNPLVDHDLATVEIEPGEDAGGRLAAWFAAHNAIAAIVRPDRYVYALATDVASLRAKLAALATALDAPASVRIKETT